MVVNKLKVWLLLGFSIILISCHKNNTHPLKTFPVVKERMATTIYYSGILQPLQTALVVSPAEGLVADVTFHYGDTVDAAAPLFVIASEKFQTDYKNALTQYIKAKTDFNNAESQLTESRFLHSNKLISDDDFKTKENNFYTAKLTLLQAKDTLSILLKQLNLKNVNLYNLSIRDIDQIAAVMHLHETTQNLLIRSPAKGVALLPMKGDGNDNQIKKIAKGEQVKAGDVLAMIGDTTGLSIRIHVNEFNINQLQVGQQVKVTGVAFPQFVLSGKIANIDRQGEMSQGGVPTFSVEIIIPTLTKEEQAVIHIGMSAKVAIFIESEAKFTVPLQALFERNGTPFVKIFNKSKNAMRDIPVKTGMTTQDKVVIESAMLKKGDEIVIAD